MTQPLDILEQVKAALDDAYAAGVRNSRREWVGLTSKEASDFVDQYWANDVISMKELIGFVEAKLKEKNT